MLSEISKISKEQVFALMVLVLSMLLSFLLGYVLFRYTKIELCKTPIEIASDFRAD